MVSYPWQTYGYQLPAWRCNESNRRIHEDEAQKKSSTVDHLGPRHGVSTEPVTWHSEGILLADPNRYQNLSNNNKVISIETISIEQ